MDYNFEQLNQRYENYTAVMRCECIFATEMVGGQPASPDGVRAYVEHHLKLQGEKAEKTVTRILTEEIGERDVTGEGEVKERLTYGLNVIRRTPLGPYIGNWMIKACAKQAASRLGLFVQLRGTKGNLAEAGRVQAWGLSLLEAEHPERIYVLGAQNGQPAETYWKRFMGRVNTPQGAVSIVHDSECLPPGSRFAFEYRFLKGKLKKEDLLDMAALMMICGLGSVKAMECGKFRIEKCFIDLGKQEARGGQGQ